MLSESALPAVICAVVTTATCPWFAEITPFTSAGGFDGVVGESLPHASLIVITQPASKASAALSVKSRRGCCDYWTAMVRCDMGSPVTPIGAGKTVADSPLGRRSGFRARMTDKRGNRAGSVESYPRG